MTNVMACSHYKTVLSRRVGGMNKPLL